MNEFRFGIDSLRVRYAPRECSLQVFTPQASFNFFEEQPYIDIDVFGRNYKLLMHTAKRIHIEECYSSINEGVRVVYESFYIGNRKLPFSVDTEIYVEKESRKLVFELNVIGDEVGIIRSVHWPQSVDYNDRDSYAYTVLPLMQGTLIPSKWQNTVLISDGRYFHHDAYMPWFAQKWDKQAYIMITETADDSGYSLEHIPGERTRISNVWYPSLSTMRYRRKCEMHFFGECDYNVFCQKYRQYLIENGKFLSLKEKVNRCPELLKRIGSPLIQEYIFAAATPTSARFSETHPEWNKSCVPFKERLRQLQVLHDIGLDNAIIHIDGSGFYGYDSGHPDVFPPCKEGGGISGMRQFIRSCHKLGYTVDLHDQYRDFFRNSPSFNTFQAIQDAENNLPGSNNCYGGDQNYLCTEFALSYIARNSRLLEENDLKADGIHLASFAGCNIDECYHPAHQMTRSECIDKRKKAFRYLKSKGYITCSDEPVDCMIDSLDMVVHAPYSLTPIEWDGMSNGINIPLFNLVYHDAIIVPWFGNRHQRGGWGIPNNDSAFAHAILNANPVGLGIDATKEDVALAKFCSDNAKRLAFVPMIKHELVSMDKRIQKTYFADGTTIKVNFNTNEYEVHYE